jgi:SpoVK/Ycf46/Vps4 family AAA+-type ATPase
MNLLIPYIKARYSILHINSAEEGRAESIAAEAATQCGIPNILVWSHSEGWKCVLGKDPDWGENPDPVDALKKITKLSDDTMVIMRDLHPFIKASPMVRRILRDISRDFKSGIKKVKSKATILRRNLIMICPNGEIHEDLKHDISLVEFSLPDENMLGDMVDDLITTPTLVELSGGVKARDQIIEACRGMTTTEASDALAKALVTKKLDEDSPSVASMVMLQKAEVLKKTGILEYYHSSVGMDGVGGLENLKSWLKLRKNAFSKKAREFGLPNPRGYLLVGVPGCGKSLCAKATAAIYDLPLIRFDMGRIFGGLVGQSEQNMRTAIMTAEAMNQCVLWIDELDKAFAGLTGGGGGDNGVAQRVFGNFITWMQEKIFFVDLPSHEEREEIFNIHIQRRRPGLELDVSDLADAADKFSGAEIEETVISALYAAFDADDELSEDAILEAITSTTPLSTSRKDDIDKMRNWASNNAVMASLKTKMKRKKKAARRRRTVDV